MLKIVSAAASKLLARWLTGTTRPLRDIGVSGNLISR